MELTLFLGLWNDPDKTNLSNILEIPCGEELDPKLILLDTALLQRQTAVLALPLAVKGNIFCIKAENSHPHPQEICS